MKKLLPLILSILVASTFIHSVSAQSNLSQGGTGWNSSTAGDILVGTSSLLRYSRFPIGSAGFVLQASSTSPFKMSWVSTTTLGINTGTVTSVSVISPTGLTVSTSSCTTSCLITIAYQAGYSPVLTASATQWTTTSNNNTNDVTLAGSPNYLTIAGQVITRALINLTSHVTGILPIANGGTGTSTAPSLGKLLMGNSSGSYDLVATSSLGISTGGGTPSAPDTSIQFNNAGSFGGSASFVWEDLFKRMIIGDVSGLSIVSSLSPSGDYADIFAENAGGTSYFELNTGGSSSTLLDLFDGGGQISLSPSLNSFIKTSGSFGVQTGAGTNLALFDTSAVASTDKTFTFPNTSGTFCIVGVLCDGSGGGTSTPSVGAFGLIQLASSTSGYFTSDASFSYATTTDLFTFLYGSSTVLTAGSLFATGQSTLNNASATVLSVSGPTFLTGKLTATTASTTILTSTGLFSSGNLTVAGLSSLGLASTTGLTVTGPFFVTGQSTMGNASTTGLTSSGTLNVTGQTTLANASATALSVSGPSFFTGQMIFGNASGTALTLSSTMNVSGKTTLANASTSILTATDLFASGNLSVTGTTNLTGKLTATTASTTILSSTGLFSSGNLNVAGLAALGLASTTGLTVSGPLYVTGNSSLTNASATSLTLSGQLYDSTNSSGNVGDVLLRVAGGTDWTATSSLGITGGGGLTGGTIDRVARWLTTTTLGTGVLIDNGTVSGVNATTSAYTFNVQGGAATNPFNIASSTGASLFTILQNGNVGIGSTTPGSLLSVSNSFAVSSTSPGTNILDVASSTGTIFLAVSQNGHIITGGNLPTLSVCGGSPTVTGTDRKGKIVTGTGAPVNCTVNFNQPYVSAPVCVAWTGSTGTTVAGSTTNMTTTSFSMTFSLGFTSGTVWYVCEE